MSSPAGTSHFLTAISRNILPDGETLFACVSATSSEVLHVVIDFGMDPVLFDLVVIQYFKLICTLHIKR